MSALLARAVTLTDRGLAAVTATPPRCGHPNRHQPHQWGLTKQWPCDGHAGTTDRHLFNARRTA